MTEQIILEGIAVPEYQDGGQAMIIEIGGGEDSEVFARLQSWSDSKSHQVLSQVAGRRLKITVEVMEDVVGDLLKRRDDARTECNQLGEALRRDLVAPMDAERSADWARYRGLISEMLDLDRQLRETQ